MSDATTCTRGRCLCGAVRYVFDPDGLGGRGHCHCESCRRATASPVTTYFTLRASALRWLNTEPKTFASSPGVTRGFCATCGTPMFWRSDATPDEIDLFAATLDDPSDFTPQSHAHSDAALPWIAIADDLPRDRSA